MKFFSKINTKKGGIMLKIKELREEAHWSQSELAEKIGSAQRNVSNWENGVSEPDCETIIKLAETFDVSLDELFGRTAYEKVRTDSPIEQSIIALVKKLTDGQKYSLMQFLRETAQA